jgi:hypothetical protein
VCSKRSGPAFATEKRCSQSCTSANAVTQRQRRKRNEGGAAVRNLAGQVVSDQTIGARDGTATWPDHFGSCPATSRYSRCQWSASELVQRDRVSRSVVGTPSPSHDHVRRRRFCDSPRRTDFEDTSERAILSPQSPQVETESAGGTCSVRAPAPVTHSPPQRARADAPRHCRPDVERCRRPSASSVIRQCHQSGARARGERGRPPRRHDERC